MTGLLETRRPDSSQDLVSGLRAAVHSAGKSAAGVVMEIWQLSRGAGKLSPNEYFYFRLFDDARYDSAAKSRFLGKRAQDELLNKISNPIWRAAAHDKLLFHTLVSALDVPTPRVQAVVHPWRVARGATTLRTVADLTSFLLHDASYPLFGKPVCGMHSMRTCAIDSVDRSSGEVVTWNGQRLDAQALAAEIVKSDPSGYLLQEQIVPHPLVRSICGARVASIRLITLTEEQGPRPFCALWKIPAGENFADNYWRSGNLMGAISLSDGSLERVIRGAGDSLEELESHPDTGTQLIGVKVPFWQDLISSCLTAATALSGIPMIAWDVALTERGPQLIEANIGGDFNLPQLAHGQGLLSAPFRAFLSSHGVELAQ